MRNLKRALSLALASVMLVGMMVVGTSAASFPDVDDSYNVEAIEVLNAVEVMIGDNGDFRPDDNVTRNEMAVIMAKLLLGKDADSYTGTHPFTDVPEWADKYVAACYNEGIVAGRSETEYDGQATVTAQEAAAMMLRALGYEKLEGTGADWARPVVAKANEIRLFKDVGSSATMPMTRNAVAQLGLNTLKADMVTTVTSGTVTTPDGTVVNLGEVKYNKVEETEANDYRASGPKDSDKDKVRQLCEELYGTDLKMAAGTDDDFGRVADYQWQYKGEEAYNATQSPVVTFTADTSKDDVLKAIKGYKFGTREVKDKDTTIQAQISVDGTNTGTADTTKAVDLVKDLTANGKLVEIFANDSTKTVTKIVTVTYTVGEVTKISTNKDGDVSYTINNGGGTKKDFADPDKDDEIVIAGSIEEDDIVTFVSKGSPAKLYVYPTTSFEGTQTSRNDAKNTIVVDGKTYDTAIATTNSSNFPNSSDAYTFYVDQYGFVVKSDAIAEETNWAIVDEIIFVEGSGLGASKYAEAKLVFPDGTSETVKVTEINGKKMKDGASGGASVDVKGDSDPGFLTVSSGSVTKVTINGKNASANALLAGVIVKYSEKDGEYKLTYQNMKDATDGTTSATLAGRFNQAAAVADGEKATTKGVPGFGGTTALASANNNTIYVIKTDDDKWSSYTGYKNVPTVTAGTGTAPTVYVTKDNAVELVYVDASQTGTKAGDSTKDMFFVTNKDVREDKSGDDSFEVLTGILNGEEGELTIEKDGTFTINDGSDNASQDFSNLNEDVLYEVEIDGDGYVTKMTEQRTTTTTYLKSNMLASMEEKDGVVAGKAYDDETVVYVIDGNDVSVGDVASAREGDVVYIKVIDASGSDSEKNTIEVMYVVKEAAAGAISDTSLTLSVAVAGGKTYNATWGNQAGTSEAPKVATISGVSGIAADGATKDSATITITATNANGSVVAVQSGTATGASLKLTDGAYTDNTGIVYKVTAANGDEMYYKVTIALTVGTGA